MMALFSTTVKCADGTTLDQLADKQISIKLKITKDNQLMTVSNGIFGININNPKDNDLLDTAIIKKIRALGIKTLRYPGGEEADNYDWSKNKFERTEFLPFEEQGTIDYLSVLKAAKEAGITDIFFEVNVEGAYFQSGNKEQNLQDYADKAADWVTAVKKAGYFVPYWEIGNEPYFRTSFPLTAEEYAHVLKVFYPKMKKADPRIKIGAAGPYDFIGSRSIGYADKLGNIGLQKLRHKMENNDHRLCKKEYPENCLKELGISYKNARNQMRWWDTIIEIALGSFDFVVTHRYGFVTTKDNNHSEERIKDSIYDFKKNIEKLMRGNVMLALTEWNVPPPRKLNMNYYSRMDHILDIADLLKDYIEGGVDYAHFWPFRLKQWKYPLVDSKDFNRQMAGQVFENLSQYHKTNLCNADTSNSQISVLCTYSGHEYSLMVINKNFRGALMTVSMKNKVTSTSVEKLMVNEDLSNTDNTSKISSIGQTVQLTTPARSVVWITIKE